MKKKNFLLALAVLVFYGLHQDFWFWHQSRPFILGFIPVGLFYHAAYSVASAGLMGLLVRFCWPAHLEEELGRIEPRPPSTPDHQSPS